MNQLNNRKVWALAGAALVAVACEGTFSDTDDPTADEFGSYEQALVGANGTVSCSNPKKTLICHIPPGNPANAHSICVGNPAVSPHVRNHGDSVGACAPRDGGTSSHPGTGGNSGSGGGSVIPQNDDPDIDEVPGDNRGTGGSSGTGGGSVDPVDPNAGGSGTGGSGSTGGATGTGAASGTGGSVGEGTGSSSGGSSGSDGGLVESSGSPG